MRSAAWSAGLALTVAACAPPRAQATPPSAFYVNESLLCRRDGASCDLWLYADGRYAVFYDRGPQGQVRNGAGPFRGEGRRGSYGARAAAGGIELCLRPDGDPPPARAGASGMLFHDAGCVVLPVHPIGEAFTLAYGGAVYSLVLAEGR